MDCDVQLLRLKVGWFLHIAASRFSPDVRLPTTNCASKSPDLTLDFIFESTKARSSGVTAAQDESLITNVTDKQSVYSRINETLSGVDVEVPKLANTRAVSIFHCIASRQIMEWTLASFIAFYHSNTIGVTLQVMPEAINCRFLTGIYRDVLLIRGLPAG